MIRHKGQSSPPFGSQVVSFVDYESFESTEALRQFNGARGLVVSIFSVVGRILNGGVIAFEVGWFRGLRLSGTEGVKRLVGRDGEELRSAYIGRDPVRLR